ncbi:hypothetical protein Sinac_0420 [Singulisphaera acidiphila DSM 18658]|uniref:Uncharacterized protein n=1 Tax=Singulisphaera acidiphila (strain ATCC BAA-1392 / DSM 18658 / VKM B-2454 / MOB10) TaxID=886293 RepID=L0D641_SINAD|nr:hypothetical protein Sinac_0420 [Singulisphaera acidiphila DSM 18658]
MRIIAVIAAFSVPFFSGCAQWRGIVQPSQNRAKAPQKAPVVLKPPSPSWP